MMVMVRVAGLRLIEMAVRPIAGLILHLDRRMTNLIMMREKMLDSTQKGVMIVGRHNLHMQSHNRFFAHLPDVNVVHIPHFRHGTTKIAFQLRNIQRDRRTLQ